MAAGSLDSAHRGVPGVHRLPRQAASPESPVRHSLRPRLTAIAPTAAEVVRLDQLGTIAAGKSADFLVLDANPLVDIHNTEKLSAVWQAGKTVPSVSAKTMSGN